MSSVTVLETSYRKSQIIHYKSTKTSLVKTVTTALIQTLLAVQQNNH